jgi:flagellar assembly protein FliH
LSNLIKSRYVYVKEEEKKIIDSNSRIEELRSLYAAKIKISDINLKEAESDEKSSGGFVEGLQFQVIETVDETCEIPEAVLEDPEQIIKDAKLEAERILERARATAKEESTRILEEAMKKGYEEGYKKAMSEGDILTKELKDKADQMDAEFTHAVQNLEPEFAEIVALLVQNITGIYTEDKQDIILYLLHKAMIHADNSREFHIKVSSEDYELVLSDRESLLNIISKGCVLEIGVDKSLEKNQCLIETDNGIIDCSLDVELNALKQDLKLLSLQME